MTEWLFSTERVQSSYYLYEAMSFVSAACFALGMVALLFIGWHYRTETGRSYLYYTFAGFFIPIVIIRFCKVELIANGYFNLLAVLSAVSAVCSIAVVLLLPKVVVLGVRLPSVNLFRRVKEEKLELEIQKVVLEEHLRRNQVEALRLKQEIDRRDKLIGNLSKPPAPIKEVISRIDERIEEAGKE